MISQENDTFSDNKSSTSKTAVNYKSKKTNISSIINDFRKTLQAIGADEKTEKKVQGYLDLTEMEAEESKPSPEIIKSNLKLASKILDKYISTTLNKNSKVVTEWVSASLLQDIDYRAQNVEESKDEQVKTEKVQSQTIKPVKVTPKDISNVGNNIDQLSKTIEKTVQTEHTTKANEDSFKATKKTQTQPKVLSPEAQEIKRLYQESQKSADMQDYKKAVYFGRQALKIAEQTNNDYAKSKIYMSMGKIYDENNDLPMALRYYNESIRSGKTLLSSLMLI